MKQDNSTPAAGNQICKGCGIEYNRSNVAREYGRESSVYLGGYHSAFCYTESIQKKSIPPLDKNGLIEICGSVVPIHEVERVWKLYCTTDSPLNLKAENDQLRRDKAKQSKLIASLLAKFNEAKKAHRVFDCREYANEGIQMINKFRAAITKHESK